LEPGHDNGKKSGVPGPDRGRKGFHARTNITVTVPPEQRKPERGVKSNNREGKQSRGGGGDNVITFCLEGERKKLTSRASGLTSKRKSKKEERVVRKKGLAR